MRNLGSVFQTTINGVLVRLHVKPNYKFNRILSVRENAVHVAVSGRPRDGQANSGVVELLSEVIINMFLA